MPRDNDDRDDQLSSADRARLRRVEATIVRAKRAVQDAMIQMVKLLDPVGAEKDGKGRQIVASARSGIPQPSISQTIAGKSIPELPNLLRLADALGVTLDEMIGMRSHLNERDAKALIERLDGATLRTLHILLAEYFTVGHDALARNIEELTPIVPDPKMDDASTDESTPIHPPSYSGPAAATKLRPRRRSSRR